MNLLRKPLVILFSVLIFFLVSGAPAPCQSNPLTTKQDPNSQTSVSPLATDAEVRSTLSTVLSGSEYDRLRRLLEARKRAEENPTDWSWLEKILQALFGSADAGNIGGAFQGVIKALLFVSVAIVLALIIVIILKSVAAKRDQRRKDFSLKDDELAFTPALPPGEMPADEYHRRALELANKQDYRSAIRELLLGGMSWIERAGLLRHRKGLTNRDYLRAVWRKPNRRLPFENMVQIFDQVYFGRRDASEERFDTCLTSFREGFQIEKEGKIHETES